MRLIVTRPEQDAGPLKQKLEAKGHSVTVMPLLDIVPHTGLVIADENWQAVCATSANAIRSFDGVAAVSHLPLLTVGPQSLAAARKAGFANASAHGGDVKGLADHVRSHLRAEDGPILYLSGAEVSGDLKGALEACGFKVVKLVVYDAVPAEAALLRSLLNEHDGVLLYSPRTAKLFVKAAPDAEAERLMYYCLSANVAAALPRNWPRAIAETPDEAALLALLDRPARTL
jgi:uroporphyrinogen-III synthase